MAKLMAKTAKQYGLWSSPISPAALADDRRLDRIGWDTDGRTLVWLEGRSGRGVLVAQGAGGDAPRELAREWDVRAEVGYGGGEFSVHGGSVFFVENKAGRLWRVPLAGGSPKAITPGFGKAASPAISPDGRWVVYVHEDDDGTARLGIVDSDGRAWPQVLASGHDFFMQPCWSPDGKYLAYVAWDCPQMPWDGSTLYLASVLQSDGGLPQLKATRVIAGGSMVAVQQPQFTPNGRHLLYISDETGWNRISAQEIPGVAKRWLTPNGVEFGLPPWVQGMGTYGVSPDSRWLTAVRYDRGFSQVVRIDLPKALNGVGDATTAAEPIHGLAGYTDVSQLVVSPGGDRVAMIGSATAIPPRVVEHHFAGATTRVVARASAESVPQEALASCEPIEWTSAGGERAYGLYYPPASDRFVGPESTLPPLVELIHGGPTSQARAGWNAQAQFFATRGYAVLLVNYRGSTGYGRSYMLRQRGQWGVCDVEDVVSAAEHLTDTGRVAPGKTVLMGGSAGGFTVLQAMVEHSERFGAGVSLYGVADQFHLVEQTHKFEAHYSDSLLGPLPEAAAVYRERSPLLHADRIRRPLALFQGDIDRVVPRAQSDTIAEALRRNGVPHIYHVYEGEGHGWRKRETIDHFYRTVDAFLRQYLLFT